MGEPKLFLDLEALRVVSAREWLENVSMKEEEGVRRGAETWFERSGRDLWTWTLLLFVGRKCRVYGGV